MRDVHGTRSLLGWHLEITSANSVEYSGLMIDGQRIVGLQVAFVFHCGDDLLTWNCRRTNRGTLWHSICSLCDHFPSPSAPITNRCQSFPHTPSRSDGLRLKDVVCCTSVFLLGYLPPRSSSYSSRLRMIANWIGFAASFVFLQNSQYSSFALL